MGQLMDLLEELIEILKQYPEYKQKYEAEKKLREEQEIEINEAIELIKKTLEEISE